MRIVARCFIVLAVYLTYESGSTLLRHEEAERSIAGILIAAAAVVVMPLPARAKRRIALGIGNPAMHADFRQSDSRWVSISNSVGRLGPERRLRLVVG